MLPVDKHTKASGLDITTCLCLFVCLFEINPKHYTRLLWREGIKRPGSGHTWTEAQATYVVCTAVFGTHVASSTNQPLYKLKVFFSSSDFEEPA